jgi:hypothetical protein
MSRTVIVTLIYHRHKLTDLIPDLYLSANISKHQYHITLIVNVVIFMIRNEMKTNSIFYTQEYTKDK